MNTDVKLIDIVKNFGKPEYVANYKNGNTAENTIFRALFDQNGNGKLDEGTEKNLWQKIVNILESNIDTEKSKKANKKDKINYDSYIENLYTKYNEVLVSLNELSASFDTLLDYEQAHKIERFGYTSEEDVPKDAVKIDVEPFEMGIWSDTLNNWTGQIYKDGYVTGFYSEEEKIEYLELYTKAYKDSKEFSCYVDEARAIMAEIENCKDIQDMVDNNIEIDTNNKEQVEKYITVYRNIRDKYNPIHQQIKLLEAKWDKIRLDGNLSEKEKQERIEQIYIKIEQYKQANDIWSIRCLNEEQLKELKEGFKSDNLSIGGGYSDSPSGSALDNFAYHLSYLTDNKRYGIAFNIDGVNASIEQKLNLGNFSATSVTSSEIEDTSLSFKENLNLRYKNWAMNLTEKFWGTSFNFKDSKFEKSTSKYFSAGLTHSTDNNISNSLQYTSSDAGKTISTDSSFPIKIFDKKHNETSVASLTITPELSQQYNTETRNYILNPQISVDTKFKIGQTETNINLTENLNSTFDFENKGVLTNMFTANASTQYKNFGGSFSFNNSTDKESHTNIYTMGIDYQTKIGTISGNCSLTHMKPKSGSSTKNWSASLSLMVPIDRIHSWIKDRKGEKIALTEDMFKDPYAETP